MSSRSDVVPGVVVSRRRRVKACVLLNPCGVVWCCVVLCVAVVWCCVVLCGVIVWYCVVLCGVVVRIVVWCVLLGGVVWCFILLRGFVSLFSCAVYCG